MPDISLLFFAAQHPRRAPEAFPELAMFDARFYILVRRTDEPA
jgi:hypothetical protein